MRQQPHARSRSGSWEQRKRLTAPSIGLRGAANQWRAAPTRDSRTSSRRFRGSSAARASTQSSSSTHASSVRSRRASCERSEPQRNERRALSRWPACFVEEIASIVEKAVPHVVICVPPLEALQTAFTGEGKEKWPAQLHDVLKARAMAHPVPMQYVLPSTYDPSKSRKQNAITKRQGQPQDEATRAWNLHTALYYKAGGYPWALVRDPGDLQTCFIGISFYWDGQEKLATSLAQVFNERGEGVIVRGGAAKLSAEDKQPYLVRDDAENLLREALAQYRKEHRHLPARVVIHKTSRFTDSEKDGFEAAADADGVDMIELVAVGRSATRFFTPRAAPPFRGTHVVLDERSQILYTTGSVPFYETYPGPYVPQPLGITLESSQLAARRHGLEILALTKLDWNHSRLEGHDPITTLAARSIGSILRHVGPNDPLGNRYAFYM